MRKSNKNILIAGLINLVFSIVELVGGLLTNSVAILSDAVNDFGDACSIAVSFMLGRRAERQPNSVYTYGYARARVMGAMATATFLLLGTIYMIYTAVHRLIYPEPSNGMWIFILSIVGIVLNGIAMIKTRADNDINSKMISLHMLEDVLGWVVVMLGSLFIWLFDLYCLDPIMSLCVSVYMLISIVISFKNIFEVLMQKCPKSFRRNEFITEMKKITHVQDVSDLHAWTLDGASTIISLHILLPNNIDVNDIINIKKQASCICKKHNVLSFTMQCDFQSE